VGWWGKRRRRGDAAGDDPGLTPQPPEHRGVPCQEEHRYKYSTPKASLVSYTIGLKEMSITIRRATVDDAEDIARIINSVVDEKKYTSLRKFSVEEEREYLGSLDEREGLFAAIKDGKIVGLQEISLFEKWSESMGHVGNILTLILQPFRGQGIGTKLAERTLNFARENRYEKISSYIIEDNIHAINYYEKIGFRVVGRWAKQVKLDGKYHDDLIVELFL